MRLTLSGILAIVASASFAVALTTDAATAQNGGTLTDCEQTVNYTLTPPASDVPPNVRAFSGIWSGKWEGHLCSVLVVESVKSDGTAALLYINGSVGGQYAVKAGNARFAATIVGNKLTSKGRTLTWEFVLQSPTQLSATRTGPGYSHSATYTRR